MHTSPARPGRPRSEAARTAVLHAVDDLLVEAGYATMTMKGIAERAGVGRQTVYRWWSTKAEILLEAVAADAREELAVEPTGDPQADLRRYVEALRAFLTTSAAGAGYRALLGEAQHDRTVATLLATEDVLFDTALAVLGGDATTHRGVAALLTGPVVIWVLTGQEASDLPVEQIVHACRAALREVARA